MPLSDLKIKREKPRDKAFIAVPEILYVFINNHMHQTIPHNLPH